MVTVTKWFAIFCLCCVRARTRTRSTDVLLAFFFGFFGFFFRFFAG